MATPSLTDIDRFSASEAGRIQANMLAQSRVRGFNWASLVPKGEFPLGMGQSISKVIYERTIPSTDSGWTQLTLNNTTGASGNNAVVTTDQINQARTTLTYSLYYRGLNSQPISIHDLALGLNAPANIDSAVKNLEGNVMDIWEDRYQDEYDRLAGHKIIAEDTNGDTPTETGSDVAWANTAPNGTLTIELLEYCYDTLMRDGGAEGLDTVDGLPTPLVICSPQTKREIFRNNTELSKNIRYSNDADILLNPLGAKIAYGNFKFVHNYRAPKYDFSAGAWTRRDFYSTSSATVGTKADPALLYKNAAYTTTYIFHPKVMTALMYDPDPSYNNGVSFEAANWMGKFKWMNGYDKTSNPDQHTGFFRCLMATATEPGLTGYGFAIRHLSCSGSGALNLASCPTT
jgi:hypothetical protein